MTNNIKEQIRTDLEKVKSTGQLRTEQIREIVRNAITQVSDEFKAGSSEISTLVKDAVLTVIEAFKDKGGEMKEEVTASIEGAMAAVTSQRHEKVIAARSELKLLQEKLDREEDELQQEIDVILAEVVDEPNKNGQDSVSQTAIKSAIASMQNSEEVTLLKKRYAQLQTQIAIIKANLAARYGGRDHDVQHYLDEAKNWYGQIRPQAETVATQIQDKHSLVEHKLGEAGVAIAQREKKLKQNLRELLLTTTDLFQGK